MGVATSTAILIGAGASLAGTGMQIGAQAGIAKRQQEAAARMREEALRFAAPTSQELENLQKQVDLYNRSYGQQTAMIEQLQKQVVEAYGPAIMEQGKQFYDQLRGEASGVVKSFDSQRARQRDRLRAQLIERMGPDALTSSAGVNALNDFDTQTSEARAQIEDQSMNNAIQRLGGLQQMQGAAGYTGIQAFQGMSNLLSSIQRGYGGIQERQVQAATGTSGPVVGTAGSEYAGMAALGQGLSDLGGQAMRFGGMMAAKEGPAPTTTDTFFTEPSFGETGFNRPTFSDRFSLGVEGVSPGPTPSRFDSGNFGDFTFNP